MLEQGLAQLLAADAAVAALAPVGGFLAQLPEGQALPSWTHTVISEPIDYLLSGPDGLAEARIQIDCYGRTAAEAVTLAERIDAVLNGYRGTLADPDQTRLAGVFRANKIDFFDQSARNQRRCLEYTVWSYQP